MDKALLIKFLQDKNTIRCGWGTEYIDTSFETMPYDFLSYAERDLKSDFEQKYINTLSNSKRSIDCQADRLLKLLGYYKDSQDKHWGFPAKLELIKRFEIIAPRVLNKINKVRNQMEHQFQKPNPEQVEDFLDIATMFIAATEQYASYSLSLVDYINEVNTEFININEVELELDNKNSKILVSTTNLNYNSKSIDFCIDKTDKDYIDILKLHLKKIEIR
jgi:hypothetical protein